MPSNRVSRKTLDANYKAQMMSEIEKLKNQILHEDQLKEVVEHSYNELLNTYQDLERRREMLGNQSNDEWKTRYENQVETNHQLTKQINMLEEKLEESKLKLKNSKYKLISEIKSQDSSNKETLEELIRRREMIRTQLKDFGWRIEQENKAYHKANEERKDLYQELIDVRTQTNIVKDKLEHKREVNIALSSIELTDRNEKRSNAFNSLPSIHN